MYEKNVGNNTQNIFFMNSIHDTCIYFYVCVIKSFHFDIGNLILKKLNLILQRSDTILITIYYTSIYYK